MMIRKFSKIRINHKVQAFTLSEVLLVLSVIGVVAALTIPTLVQKISDDQYRAAWKKNYSALSQATNLMLATNGGDLANTFTTDESLRNEYTKHMNFVRTCETTNTLGNCWHGTAGKFLNGTSAVWTSYPGAILNDGTLVRVSKLMASNPSISAFNVICVDVNGYKGPNTIGKDIYYMWVTNNGIRPWGITGDIAANDPVTTCIENSTAGANTGYGCSVKHLYQ